MQGPKHILVVDDDGDVREVVAEIALDLGYRVSVADGGKAMRAFLDGSDPVDLVVLDASMPGEASASLAVHAAHRRIRLVMISGSPERMEEAHDSSLQLLHKPFMRADLERAIQHAVASSTFGQREADPD